MSRLATILASLADTALAVVVGVVVPLAIGTIGWFASGSYRSVDWEVLLTVALAVWTLGLNSAVGIEITPDAYPSLGLDQPFGFVIAIAPMLVTALIVWFGYRTGARILNDDEEAPWLAAAASICAFPLLNFIALSISPLDNVRLEPNGVLVGGTLLWLASLVLGLRAWEYIPWERLLGERAGAVLTQLRLSVRHAVGLVTGLAAAATVLMLVVLVFRFGEVIGLMQVLQLGPWGVIALGLVQLAYLPTFIVWAMSWMLGAGFDLGIGSHAGPGGTDAGPLPVVPMFGLIPEGIEPVWWAIVAVPFAIAVVFTFCSRIFGLVSDEQEWWQRLVVPAAGSLLAALMIWILAYLSQGGLGPGRLVQFGPSAGLMPLAALGVFLAGSIIGTLVPLHAVDPSRGPVHQAEGASEGDDEHTAPQSHPHSSHTERVTKTKRGWRDRLAAPVFAPWDEPEDDPDSEADEDDEYAELDELIGSRAATPESGAEAEVDAAVSDDDSPSRASRGKRDTALRDVLDRPGEPDIYADLD